jgi:hypothetical protein
MTQHCTIIWPGLVGRQVRCKDDILQLPVFLLWETVSVEELFSRREVNNLGFAVALPLEEQRKYSIL